MSVRYELIVAHHKLQLAKLVNASLNKGWKVQGGVSVVLTSSLRPDGLEQAVFYQAMIKELP